jgi:hypothetical protein
MDTITAPLSCSGCPSSRASGLMRCLWCGAAIRQGRCASQQEEYETSDSAREERIRAIGEARRDPQEIDARVRVALGDVVAVQGEFTHDLLIPHTHLNACALKFSLKRLADSGVVVMCGLARIRSNRTRPIWKLLRDPRLVAAVADMHTDAPAVPQSCALAR